MKIELFKLVFTEIGVFLKKKKSPSSLSLPLSLLFYSPPFPICFYTRSIHYQYLLMNSNSKPIVHRNSKGFDGLTLNVPYSWRPLSSPFAFRAQRERNGRWLRILSELRSAQQLSPARAGFSTGRTLPCLPRLRQRPERKIASTSCRPFVPGLCSPGGYVLE